MKQLPLNSRHWLMIVVASGILMIGVLQAAKMLKKDPDPQPTVAGTDQSLPLNTLDDPEPPPMPGLTDVTNSGSDIRPKDPPPPWSV